METIGLIAGNGNFPILFAREARERGYRVVAVAHRGETRSEIGSEVDEIVWVRVGQLGRMLRAFKGWRIRRAVMAGGINKVRSLLGVRPDLRGMLFLRRAVSMGDDALLRGLAAEFEADGIEIVPSTIFLDRIVAAAGHIAGPDIDDVARGDIRLGASILAAMGPLDIGQSVVVEKGVVLAVEAIEGTDAAIRRAGELGRGRAVVVKAAKRGQDMRFDVPAVGTATIETMKASGAAVLAVQAGATILLDDDFAQVAGRAGISVIGYEPQSEDRA